MTALTQERLAYFRRIALETPRCSTNVALELLAHIDHLQAVIDRMRGNVEPYVNETLEAGERAKVSNPEGGQ